MNKKVAEVRTEQWRQTIYDCINCDSKVSKRQWCKENGIRYRSFMYWQHKFQLEALGRMDNQETMLPIKQDAVNTPVFADVTSHLKVLQAEQESAPKEPESMHLAPELMIQIGSFRIYVNGSVQDSTLETVMRVIRHA